MLLFLHRRFALRECGFESLFAAGQLGRRIGGFLIDSAKLGHELRHLMRESLFAFTLKLQLLFETRYFGIGRVKFALRRVQRVAGLEMTGAQVLQIGFGLP